jgi:hypothetical protein
VGTLHLVVNVLTIFATELSNSARGTIPTLDILILRIISCLFWKSQWCRASITFYNETQSGHTSLEVNCFFFFLGAPCIFWTSRFSDQDGGRHSVKLVRGINALLLPLVESLKTSSLTGRRWSRWCVTSKYIVL